MSDALSVGRRVLEIEARALEQLSASLVRRDYTAGSVAMSQGAPGDVFHVVAAGRADVEVDGARRTSLGTGDCFGEIALLRASPRTATVTAATNLTTYTLDRDTFLRVVSGHREVGIAAESTVRSRLRA